MTIPNTTTRLTLTATGPTRRQLHRRARLLDLTGERTTSQAAPSPLTADRRSATTDTRGGGEGRDGTPPKREPEQPRCRRSDPLPQGSIWSTRPRSATSAPGGPPAIAAPSRNHRRAAPPRPWLHTAPRTSTTRPGLASNHRGTSRKCPPPPSAAQASPGDLLRRRRGGRRIWWD